MTAWQAVGSLIALLDDTAPAGHVSARRPSVAADLPAVAVAVSEATDIAAGLGGLVQTRKLSDTAWSNVTASRTEGVFALELWAADVAGVNALVDAVVEGLTSDEGFMRLTVCSLGPIDVAPLGFGGTATALRLPLGVAFVHETPVTEDIGSGGLIKTVHVEMTPEAMDIGR